MPNPLPPRSRRDGRRKAALTTSQLAQIIADEADLPLDLATDALGAVLSHLRDFLGHTHGTIDIRGFGTLSVAPRWVFMGPGKPRKRLRTVTFSPAWSTCPLKLTINSDYERWFRAVELSRNRRNGMAENGPDPDMLP